MIKTCLCGARPLTPIAKAPRNASSQLRFIIIVNKRVKDMEIRSFIGMEEVIERRNICRLTYQRPRPVCANELNKQSPLPTSQQLSPFIAYSLSVQHICNLLHRRLNDLANALFSNTNLRSIPRYHLCSYRWVLGGSVSICLRKVGGNGVRG